MTIHKEGTVFLMYLLIGLLLLNVGVMYWLTGFITLKMGLVLCSFLLFFFVLHFFRSPLIQITPNEHYILAPADGKVVVVEETMETEYLHEKRIQVSIFMSPLNVHVNRMPVGGAISYYAYHAGKYLLAWHPKSSIKNERTTVAIKMKTGTEILVRQIAGAIARRIKCYASKDQMLQQGQEFGFIKFGSRVDVFIPVDATMKVRIGDKTKGGRSILAELE